MAVFGKYVGDTGRFYSTLDLGPLTNGVVVDFTSINGGSYPADGRWQSDAGPATYTPPVPPTAYTAPADHGLFANRPAAAQLANQRYVATDLSIEYYSDGSTWYTLGSAASSTPGQTLLANSTTPEAHGAVGDNSTDDTAAIQAAIDAVHASCQTDGTYTCEVIFDPRKTYLVAGALVQGGTRKTNSQITIPMAPAGQAVVLRLAGAAGPISEYSGTSKSRIGATIRSSLTAQAYSGTFGKPSVVGGPTTEQIGEQNFNTTTLIVDGLTVLTPDNPTLGGWNFEQIRQVQIGPNGIQAATNVADTSITACTHAHAWGVALPRLGNSGVVTAGFMYASGYYGGVAFSEHTNIRQINAWQNIVCLIPAGEGGSPTGAQANPALIDSVLCENHKYMIAKVDPSSGVVAATVGAPVFRILMLDFERTAAGSFAETFSIYDPNNALSGTIAFKGRAYGGGAAINLTYSGGDNLFIDDVADRAWHTVGAAGEPAFFNSWVNFDPVTYSGAQFRLEPGRLVRLRGIVKSGTVGTSVFQLPVKYRPTKPGFASVVSNSAFGDLGIGADGSIVVNVGSNVNVMLDCVFSLV